jgi:acetoin utilization protein AcuB
MNVSDVMTAQPATITSNAPLKQALDIMHQIGCHHLPVLSAEKHLIGVVSINDIQRALGEPIKPDSPMLKASLAGVLRVSMIMTPAPIIVEPDAPAQEAARLMLKHFIGCLPVMRGETLVGIITRSDLLMAFMALSEKITHLSEQ